MFKIELGLFASMYMVITLLAFVLVIILPLKYSLRRERPSRITSVYRICNMRDRENKGRFHSMPSGDAAAGAFICITIAFLFNCPMILAGIPFTCLGRVYAHCHWFGDTLVGAFIGVIAGYYFYHVYFKQLSHPVFVAIMLLFDKQNANHL